MQQAGLATPAKQRVAAGGAAAAAAAAAATSPSSSSSSSTHLFVGLVQSQRTGRQHVAAVMLGPAGLLVSSGGALEPPRLQPGRRQGAAAVQRDVTCLTASASGCCWLGTADGELLPWQLAGHDSGGAVMAVPDGRVHGCCSGGAISSACAMPSGKWKLMACTAGGCCTLLVRR